MALTDLLSYVFMGFAGLIAFVWLTSCIYVVTPRSGRIIQFFGGKISHVQTTSGIYLKLPTPFHTVTKSYSLSQESFDTTVRIKSSDEVFLDLKLACFYQVNQHKLQEAVFDLEDPLRLMMEIISQPAKEICPTMTVQEIYTEKDKIQEKVLTEMTAYFSKHGFDILRIVVGDPQLDQATQDASNKVYAASRDLEAAKKERLALYEREMGAATAAAESLKTRMLAAGEARVIYAGQFANALNNFIQECPKGTLELLQQSFEGLDKRDMIITASGKEGNLTIIAVDNPQHAHNTAMTKALSQPA